MSKKPRAKWDFDPDNWPDQRTNIGWHDLTRQNKYYAINAYNIARRNRGLEEVPNPFDKEKNKLGNTIIQNPDGEETVTPKSGKPKLQPKNRNAIKKWMDTRKEKSLEPEVLRELDPILDQEHSRYLRIFLEISRGLRCGILPKSHYPAMSPVRLATSLMLMACTILIVRALGINHEDLTK